MGGDRQTITKDCNDYDDKKYSAVDVSLLEGEIESKPARVAAATVSELESTQHEKIGERKGTGGLRRTCI
jgi:hypothetical protein